MVFFLAATWSSFSITVTTTTTAATVTTGAAKRQRSKLVVAVGAATEETGLGWAVLVWVGLVLQAEGCAALRWDGAQLP